MNPSATRRLQIDGPPQTAVAFSTEGDPGGPERVSMVDRVGSLTGIRAVAALLVVGTHAAYGTGKDTHGYVGLIYSRLEIGVPIFFVLSGFLLFDPWARAAATGFMPPAVRRYAWRRLRRIVPAYVVTVLLAYLVYQFRTDGPDPGQTWMGLFRYLTLTQIYTDNYALTYLHQGLTQMWSLAVEAAFYAALPLLAHLLLVVLCRRRWRPVLLLAGLAALAALTPAWLIVLHTTDWLPGAAGMWLPAYLACFVGGMALAVLQAMGARCYAFAAIPLALVSYLIVSTPIAGDATMSPVKLWEPLAKTVFYTIIAALVVAPLALGDRGGYARLLSSRPMVWLGEISYEIFLIHVLAMAIATDSVLRWPVFTGSVAGLFVVTLVITVPLAWVLHRVTHPDTRSERPFRPERMFSANAERQTR
jgi:peptidoglycan/LPS O-acetylase OafA/YrhL